MTAVNNPIALKEWAVAIEALREGKQILIMRKGGIVEETRDFQVESHDFYLYPTYEHQKKEVMKDDYKDVIDQTLVGWSASDTTVRLTTFAHVVEDIEVSDQEQLDKLRDLHVWTDTFAVDRLRWKKDQPLHVLLLRAYDLEEPITIDIHPDYLGCKSWVQIAQEIPAIAKRPVLTDEEFAAQVSKIKAALAAE